MKRNKGRVEIKKKTEQLGANSKVDDVCLKTKILVAGDGERLLLGSALLSPIASLAPRTPTTPAGGTVVFRCLECRSRAMRAN